jgi:hypothetical protein
MPRAGTRHQRGYTNEWLRLSKAAIAQAVVFLLRLGPRPDR